MLCSHRKITFFKVYINVTVRVRVRVKFSTVFLVNILIYELLT